MKNEVLNSKIEVYVCNFKRDNGESCFERGAKELTDNLKTWAKKEHPNEIKVIRGGCLGKCSEGIVISCYPERKLLLEVELKDEEEIKKGLTEALLKN
jgi:(2Fe-2S) ferredoxin